MPVAGCDIGSLTAKAVILEDSSILSSEVMGVRPTPEQSAEEVMDKALSGTSHSMDDIDYLIGTGYGRVKIPFADENITEISCHGKGAHWLVPSVRTVIDVGGQDCKVIRVDEEGGLEDFIMNDKCAAGTGRFLEVMAETLGVGIEDLGPLGEDAEDPVNITSQCSIYAETEVMSYMGENTDSPDLAAGINKAMAQRVKALVERVGMKEDTTITGGVAKNIGVVKNLENMLGVEAKEFEEDSQIVGALGAALFAKERLSEN